MNINRKTILSWLFGTSFLIGALHLGALKYSWYWLYWWFDIPVHFLGGIVVALISLYVYLKYSSAQGSLTKKQLFWVTFLGVLVIGLLWEAFELVVGGRAFADSDYMLDTISDIFTNISGSALVYVIISSIYERKS